MISIKPLHIDAYLHACMDEWMYVCQCVGLRAQVLGFGIGGWGSNSCGKRFAEIFECPARLPSGISL